MRRNAIRSAVLASMLIQGSVTATAAYADSGAQEATIPNQLIDLFQDWRSVAEPAKVDGVPDFSDEALSRKKVQLDVLRARLEDLDRSTWSDRTVADARLIAAEMNGLDFDLRILRPWSRDPSYYATVFADQSDVPAHEGPSADVLDLFAYDWPLSKPDAERLTVRMEAVPILLNRARSNLSGGNAADFWAYGTRAFEQQTATLDALLEGSLELRSLTGTRTASLEGASGIVDADLRQSVLNARDASAEFGRWIATQAPGKTGPSGMGKEQFNWYMKNVQLVPYDWDEQVSLFRRELERSWSMLAMEEHRNRDLPPLEPIENPEEYRAFAKSSMQTFVDFVIDNGFIEDKPIYRQALETQTLDYIAPEDRNFFYHVTARDPLPLYSHFVHWVELARLAEEPSPDPIRRAPSLFNIYAARSEGYATAFEEIALNGGLYEDRPRARELVWIMLANRAARGLASLYVQANELDLERAGQLHSRWTPRGWSDVGNPLVGFEQLLYLRQPGYGTSYITGKLLLDRLIAERRMEANGAERAFDLVEIFRELDDGIMPWPLMMEEPEWLMTGQHQGLVSLDPAE